MTNEEALKVLKYRSGWNLSIRDVNALDMAIKALERESQTFEWCTDCREYDQEKHCCHRWSKVIRNTVEEMKQPCEDAISRAQAQTEIEMNACRYTLAKERDGMGQVEWSDQLIKVSDTVDIIRNLPSVKPLEQQPKMGHWIYTGNSEVNGLKICKCSNCEKKTYGSHKFCPNCGAKMVKPQESEGKE